MSCRTSPAGSLGTTFVQNHYRLEDAQCTSMFHELRRTHERGNIPTATVEDYNTTLDLLEEAIATSPGIWFGSRKERALERVRRAKAAGYPDPAIATALVHISNRSRKATVALTSFKMFTSIDTGIPADLLDKEAHRLYKEYSPDLVNVATYNYRDIVDLPADAATGYALGVLDARRRCQLCGQFIGAAVHICPPENRRPLRQFLQAQPLDVIEDLIMPDDVIPTVASILEIPENQTLLAQVVADLHREDLLEEEENHSSAFATPAPQTVETAERPSFDSLWLNPELQTWDMEEFQAMYDAAKEEVSQGNYNVTAFENPLPGQVTGGLGARHTGNSFGIEIELDFPDEDWPYEARENFARMLYEEGIVTAPFVQRWHHVGDDRPGGSYVEDPNGWICEFDRSVDDVDGERGVEIKSQILYDEPQTWHNIGRICSIAKELGGEATMRTGLHINVGGANFPSEDPTAHNSLLRLAAAYDDTLLRLAHNPRSGPRHRGRGYCGYAAVPVEGYRNVAVARSNSNHYQAFNLGHLPASGERHRNSSRVEARIWDSTLDLGRIQASTTASLALVKLALDNVPPGQHAEPSGSHRERFGSSKLEGDAWTESTEAFRNFVSIMGKAGAETELHKQMFTKMFASSRWQDRY